MEFSDLAKLASGHVEARIIQVAVELEVFGAIKNETLSGRAVASVLGSDPEATELLLNALVALGLLEKHDERFALSEPAKKYLVKDSEHYFGEMIRFDGFLWDCWGRLEQAVRSGKPVRPAEMYQENSTATAYFINAMDSLVKARGDAEIVANILDWSGISEMLDIGSGPGTYPIHLCRRFPQLRATIFDLSGTMKLTEEFVRRSGVADRVRLIRGDYRTDSIPGRYDLIFLSNIIHGEPEEENERLIVKLTSKLEPGGRIIIKDHVLDSSRTHPTVGAIFSLLMLLTTNRGRCYSFDEIKTWMTAAGLTEIQQIPLPPPLTSSLVIGKP
jgi:SAM-dependent methyltransferase